MFTEIEGDWDEVTQVVKDATFVLASKGIRTNVVTKADIRPGRTNRLTGKVEKLDSILGEKRGRIQAGFRDAAYAKA
ncbi:MAG: thiamine-binding protein [Defluviitaleaceae bacterium]|nr:thiamine-binding protein [Defluviitaleaceae bacterium]